MRHDLLRRVKQEFEWETYVRDMHTVKETGSDELRVCCFSCGDDKYKLYVNPSKGAFHCFKCDFSSKKFDVFDFVSRTEAIGRGQAMARLIREYGRITPEDDAFEEQLRLQAEGELSGAPGSPGSIKTLAAMPEGLEVLTERTDASARFWDYLVGRGLTPEEIRAIKFHYSPRSEHIVYDSKGKRKGDLANRIVVPIYGGQHELVSWQGRMINNSDTMKYLTAPESELAKTVWPYVRPASKHAIVCEGVYDALATRRCDVDAYASFTKKISLDQLLRLKSWGIEELTLFWDKRDAKREIISAVTECQMQMKKVYVSRMTDWPDKLDAGNMLAEPQGTDMLKKALEDRVDTYDSLEYAKWKMKF